MTLVRRAATFCAVGLLVASAAMANVPNKANSTQPNPLRIQIVGHGSPPDPAGNVTYTIRDGQAIPALVIGSVVILNFSQCTDVRLCASPVSTGISVNCLAKTATGVTDGAGQVTFAICGTSNLGAPTLLTSMYNNADGSAAVLGKCVTVTADGEVFDNMSAATADYDGIGGVAALDLGFMGADINFANTRARSDFIVDGSNVVNALDLGKFAALLAPHVGSGTSCGGGVGDILCP